jgi:hypothetical protein
LGRKRDSFVRAATQQPSPPNGKDEEFYAQFRLNKANPATPMQKMSKGDGSGIDSVKLSVNIEATRTLVGGDIVFWPDEGGRDESRCLFHQEQELWRAALISSDIS